MKLQQSARDLHANLLPFTLTSSSCCQRPDLVRTDRDRNLLTILKCTGGPPNAVDPRYHPWETTSHNDFPARARLHLEDIAIIETRGKDGMSEATRTADLSDFDAFLRWLL